MISKGRLVKLIHIAVQTLKLSDETYRGMLHSRYQKRSSLDLSETQASELLDELRQMGFKLLDKRQLGTCSPCEKRGDKDVSTRPADDVLYDITPGQETDIKQLRANITWSVPNGYNRWLMKYHHVFKVEDSLTASRVIAALRAMCQQQHGCGYCGIDARRGAGRADFAPGTGGCSLSHPRRNYTTPAVDTSAPTHHASKSAPAARKVYYIKKWEKKQGVR